MTTFRFSLLFLAGCAALASCGGGGGDPSRQENEAEAQVNQGTRWEVDEAAFHNEINRMEEEERELAHPSAGEGYAIPSPSDPGVRYRILSVNRLPDRHLEVLSRRDGPSGTSFARREIDCEAMTYRYLGEGDSRAEAEADSPNPGPMTELTETSASSDVAVAVCARPH
jgi:hypothetical protein